ncbi:MAG: sialidase family protein, partial [Bacteroidota bacterium]|nr:sialidase family protein [Bacteroidota bacterium]
MKLSYFFIIPAIYLLFPIYGCSKEADVPGDTPDNPNFVRETAAPLNGLRIAWDRSTRQKISTVPGYNGYPRVKRLHDHSIGAVYESPGCGVFQRSTDGGSTWSSPVKVFTQQTVSNANGSTAVNISNTEFLQLDDGSIIAGCNYRPATDGITPYAIVVSRSTDLGATWSTPQVIYGSQSNFENGCWEPSFLQLPDGTVHCYFA